jgi:hypothetical protein
MAFIYSWGGDPNNNNGYVLGATTIEQRDLGAPSGNLNLAGARPIRISNITADYSTNGAWTSIVYQGVVTTGQLFGSSGGVFSFRINTGAGQTNYGRNTAYGWQIWENGSPGFLAALCGQFHWSTVSSPVQSINSVRTGNSVRVTFSQPASDGGAAITHFVIYTTYFDPNTGAWSGWHNPITTAVGDVTFSNLVAGRQYAWLVTSVNVNGESQGAQTATHIIPQTGDRFDGSAFVPMSFMRRMISPTDYATVATGKRFNGSSWVDLS